MIARHSILSVCVSPTKQGFNARIAKLVGVSFESIVKAKMCAATVLMKRENVWPTSRVSRSDAICEDTKVLEHQWWKDMSSPSPNTKDVKNCMKADESKRYIQCIQHMQGCTCEPAFFNNVLN